MGPPRIEWASDHCAVAPDLDQAAIVDADHAVTVGRQAGPFGEHARGERQGPNDRPSVRGQYRDGLTSEHGKTTLRWQRVDALAGNHRVRRLPNAPRHRSLVVWGKIEERQLTRAAARAGDDCQDVIA